MTESQPTETLLKKNKKISKWLLRLIFAIVVLFISNIAWKKWEKYSDNKPYKITKYAEISLGDAQNEIFYSLGPPTEFISPTQSVDNIYSEGNPSYYNSIEWLYTNELKRIHLGFDKPRGRVFSIECYSTGYLQCPTLFGIHDGSSEDEVLSHLGKPSSEEIEDVTKIIRYPQYNLTLYLTKRKVYMLKVSQDAI